VWIAAGAECASAIRSPPTKEKRRSKASTSRADHTSSTPLSCARLSATTVPAHPPRFEKLTRSVVSPRLSNVTSWSATHLKAARSEMNFTCGQQAAASARACHRRLSMAATGGAVVALLRLSIPELPRCEKKWDMEVQVPPRKQRENSEFLRQWVTTKSLKATTTAEPVLPQRPKVFVHTRSNLQYVLQY